MATPRADSTLAERVKKLEQDFRRIRLVPSTTQTDVAPLAAVKGAVWIDSSAGNEPKVFDGTGWVPARDATIAVAQGTADAAQADVTPLIPLTDLAGATTGLVVTGATNVTTDPGTGAHVVVNDPAYPGEIALYSGNANEVVPARIRPVLGGANFGQLELRSPDLTGAIGGYSFIELDGYDDGSNVLIAQADTVKVDGSSTVINGFTEVAIGDGSNWVTFNGNIVTDADLTSPTNTFPANPQPVTVTESTLLATQASTTYAAGSPVCGVAFTAPATGKAYVTLSSHFLNNNSTFTSFVSAVVRDGSTIGSGATVRAASDHDLACGRTVVTNGQGELSSSRRFLVTGLTAGQPYNVRVEYRVTGGSTNILNRELLVEPVL